MPLPLSPVKHEHSEVQACRPEDSTRDDHIQPQHCHQPAAQLAGQEVPLQCMPTAESKYFVNTLTVPIACFLGIGLLHLLSSRCCLVHIPLVPYVGGFLALVHHSKPHGTGSACHHEKHCSGIQRFADYMPCRAKPYCWQRLLSRALGQLAGCAAQKLALTHVTSGMQGLQETLRLINETAFQHAD